MTTFKARLRPSSVEGNPGSIVYVVTEQRIARTVTSEHKVYEDEWDKKHGCVKVGIKGERKQKCDSISKKVKMDLKQLEKIEAKFKLDDSTYTADDIIQEFLNLRESFSFFKFMEDVIESLNRKNQHCTCKNYRSALNSFRAFINQTFGNQYELDVREITPELMEEYEAWLKRRGVKRNTISFYMRILRATYNRTVKQGLVSDCHPFANCFTGNEKTVKRAITIDEIKKIKDLDLSQRPDLAWARDIFLFIFFCMGMSPIDAAYLKQKDISMKDIRYSRSKTKQPIVVGLNKHIRGVLKSLGQSGSEYLLPILTDGADRKQYEAALRKINRLLKEVGRLANISIPLTTYVCRHSWASIAKAKGILTSVIADALGHDSEKTTSIYLASFSHEEINKANELVLKGL